ncbi:MAG: L-threonylcarbamoyladenylate synthase, partial [Pseudomonadota bacterium]
MVPTQIIPTDAEDVLARVVTVLRNGGLAALPTETVYGLCARADRDEAVRAIFAAKGRPAHNPLIVHGANVEMLSEIGVFGAVANALAERFWPGPLTLVLERKESAPVSALACAGGPTVAVRIPEGSLLREASAAIGPLVAPSANRSGRVSATTADAVMAELSGRIELLADGGPSLIGLESTVVDVTGSPTLLRPGAIPAEALEAIVGPLAS